LSFARYNGHVHAIVRSDWPVWLRKRLLNFTNRAGALLPERLQHLQFERGESWSGHMNYDPQLVYYHHSQIANSFTRPSRLMLFEREIGVMTRQCKFAVNRGSMLKASSISVNCMWNRR
jgi:hypothetical protein